MAGTAAARAGLAESVHTDAPGGGRSAEPVSRFAVAIAAVSDELDIGALLRTATLPGAVSVSLAREPSPLAAATIEGDTHQLIVARDRASGGLAGVAARSVRDVYVNGAVARVGYLGQLRVDRSCRQLRTLMNAGFAFCRDLHDAGDAPFYLTSLVADNEAARRLLVEGRLRAAPRFVPVDTLRTFVIPVQRPRPERPVAGIHLEAGSEALLGHIEACLHRNLGRYQFAPRWTAGDLRSSRTRGLAPEHFSVALRGDRVVGCLARWDQRAFKQVVVRGYSKGLARWRPFVNLAARWLDVPALPPVGNPLPCAYLSHAAVDDDDEDVLAALVADQCRRARSVALTHLVTAFVPRHPFHHAIAQRFRHRAYDSALYLAFWPDGAASIRGLEARIPQPEVAVL